MRVVCAACNLHYADLEDVMPFAEKLVWSDSLAEWHAPHCTASREEHAAALEIIEAVEAVEDDNNGGLAKAIAALCVVAVSAIVMYGRQQPDSDAWCVPHNLNVVVCKEVRLSWAPLAFIPPGPAWWVNR